MLCNNALFSGYYDEAESGGRLTSEHPADEHPIDDLSVDDSVDNSVDDSMDNEALETVSDAKINGAKNPFPATVACALSPSFIL